MDVQSRVVNYYKSNQFIQKYLMGIDSKTNEVVLKYNGEKRRVSVDVLENLKSEEELISNLEGKVINNPSFEAPVREPIVSTVAEEKLEEPSSPSPIPQEQAMLTEELSSNKETLNDIKILTELKNKTGLDNVLKRIAVNESTGLIDINTAISKVTRATMDEVKKAINGNYEFSTDLNSYDINGRLLTSPVLGSSTEDEKIMRSFNNIKVLLDAAKMYPEQANYNEEQVNSFMKTYIDKVKEEVHGKEIIKPSVSVENNNVVPMQRPKAMTKELSRAGFADIFVLTVIVLIYAVIIVNLIMKLS